MGHLVLYTYESVVTSPMYPYIAIESTEKPPNKI